MSRTGWTAGIVCWLVCAAAGTCAEPVRKTARDGAAASDRPGVELNAETIKRRLKQVENNTNLDESVRKSLIEKYNAALEHLKTADEHKAKADELRQQTAEAPAELERLKAAIKSPPPEGRRSITPDMGLAEMQEALTEAEKQYEELQKELADFENEPARRVDRRKEIPGLLESIRD